MPASRSTLWLLFNLALGLAAGMALAWGPLAAPAPIIAVLGLAGALLGGVIGWWSRPRARPGDRVRRCAGRAA
jgi:xanthosine utilization system XapX-like protein